MDKCVQSMSLQCPLLYYEKYITTFGHEADPVHFEVRHDSEENALCAIKSEYKKASWSMMGKIANGSIPQHYMLPKYKDIIVPCEEVMQKKGPCCRVRPILPYTPHPLRTVMKRGGKALGLIVKELPEAEQFAISDTVTVTKRLRHWKSMAHARYGTNFRWMAMVGDVSAMYDEIDPVVAVAAVKRAMALVPEWRGKRTTSWINMRWSGKDVKWGRTSEEGRVEIHLDVLLDLCKYDCFNTMYVFEGRVNRRKFGVPMGGYMSPAMAILALAMAELVMTDRPDELIGGNMRYMDDVLSVYAISTLSDAFTVFKWFTTIEQGYPPPLKLNVEEESNEIRFLELIIKMDGCNISCCLFNKAATDALAGKPVRQRLPEIGDGTNSAARRSLLIGMLHRVVDGCLTDADQVESLWGIVIEMQLAGWPISALVQAIRAVLRDVNVGMNGLEAVALALRS